MSTNSNFDRIAEAWLADGPTQLADRVLDDVLVEVHLTRQRRPLWVPWRFPSMPISMRLVAAAVVGVIAIGVLYLNLPGRGGVGGPSPSPSATATPAVTAALPIGQRFTSTIHSIALSYPSGWATRAATEPWTTPDVPRFADASVDVMYDPAQTDHLFLAVASQPLAGKTPEAWATALATGTGCPDTEPMHWNGLSAWIDRTCRLFFVGDSDTGWVVFLYASDLSPVQEPAYNRLFEDILGTGYLYAAPAG